MNSRPVRIAAVCAAALGFVWPSSGHAQEQSRPMMDRDRPVQCYRDNDGQVWRVQCNSETKVCLYAPNEELDGAGRRAKPLERAKRCPIFNKQPFDRAALENQGFTFVAGRPDAPYGWTRDERGRVFQINFDLKRRMYIGGSYAPASRRNSAKSSKSRSSVDFGLLVFEHYGGSRHSNRHRVRLVEGEVFLEPFSAELTLVHYDMSRRFLEPLLRVTTFFGTPKRYDLHLNLGLWAEGGQLEVHQTQAVDSSLWRFATGQLTLDLWQSARLDSFARLRTGVGIERLYAEDDSDRSAVTLGSAFEIDWILDNKGFHNLRAEIRHEIPRYFETQPDVGTHATRMQARFRYEAIILAINDQPLSLRLDAGTEKRNDIPGIPNEWAFVANAGLRFSLWAPPRSPG
jgi:hypothetical protein